MTKKLYLIGVVSMVAAAAIALENITLPTGGGFYEGTLYQSRTITASNTTAVTPRYVGELLLGKESGSNALWVARNLTTNGWGLVTAEGGPFGNANITDVAASKLTEGSTATAIDGQSITNTAAGNLKVGGSLSAVNGLAVTNLNAASLRVGTTAEAISGSAITNLTAGNIAAAGNLPAVDGSAVTNIGNSAITTVSATKLTAATIATAIDGSSITNLGAANLKTAGSLTAVNGAAVTNLTAANVANVTGASAITNNVLVEVGDVVYTNIYIMYPFGGGYMIKSITVIP